MARFTVHRVTADYTYSDGTAVGEGWLAESAEHAQTIVENLKQTRPELYNFKITATGFGFDSFD